MASLAIIIAVLIIYEKKLGSGNTDKKTWGMSNNGLDEVPQLKYRELAAELPGKGVVVLNR